MAGHGGGLVRALADIPANLRSSYTEDALRWVKRSVRWVCGRGSHQLVLRLGEGSNLAFTCIHFSVRWLRRYFSEFEGCPQEMEAITLRQGCPICLSHK